MEMNEFKEFQEIQEQNSENLEARLEEQSQELLKKADALIESSAELLAEDSPLTKEEIIERVQEESLKELGKGYSKEDFAPVGSSSEVYSPSFGSWSKYDSDRRDSSEKKQLIERKRMMEREKQREKIEEWKRTVKEEDVHVDEFSAPIESDSKAYSPSFGQKWSKYDSDIKYTASEMERDAKAGRKIATENRLKEIEHLEDKREEDLAKKEAKEK